MSVPTEKGNVIIVAADDDAIATGRKFIMQGVYAKAASVLTDGAGGVVADMLAGASITFPQGLTVNGLNVTGTGPVYVYLR